jgi:hypothetical protein
MMQGRKLRRMKIRTRGVRRGTKREGEIGFNLRQRRILISEVGVLCLGRTEC